MVACGFGNHHGIVIVFCCCALLCRISSLFWIFQVEFGFPNQNFEFSDVNLVFQIGKLNFWFGFGSPFWNVGVLDLGWFSQKIVWFQYDVQKFQVEVEVYRAWRFTIRNFRYLESKTASLQGLLFIFVWVFSFWKLYVYIYIEFNLKTFCLNMYFWLFCEYLNIEN